MWGSRPHQPRFFAVLAAACCLTASAQIQVLSPSTLRTALGSSGKIEGSTATFGTPDFGTTLQGRLFYGKSLTGKTYCEGADYDIPRSQQDYAQVQELRIIVVRRGDCSFVTKVTVAQNEKAAAAVIIVDKPPPDGETREQLRNIIVADDGWGSTVKIPSILITNEDGEKLISEIERPNSAVVVELSWEIPTNDIVVVDKWMDTTDKKSVEFLTEFAKWRTAFRWQLNFHPHFLLGPSLRNSPSQNHYQCIDEEGKYCIRDPDREGVVTGADVIRENIRMLCLHELTEDAATDDYYKSKNLVEKPQYSKAFWDYIAHIQERCPVDKPSSVPAAERFGEECSFKLMEEVKIDKKHIDKIRACAHDNEPGKIYEGKVNFYLEKMKNQIAWSNRALRINGWRYTGDLNIKGVVGAVCAAYTRPPPVCQEFREGATVPSMTGGSSKGALDFKTLLLAFGIVIIVTVGGLLLYQRSLRANLHSALREEVMLEVQSQMETYKQLPS